MICPAYTYVLFCPTLQQGCVEIAEANTGASVAETERRMCGSIYNEAVSESEEGKVPEMLQDLFMEQG